MFVSGVLTMRSLLPAELQGTGQSLFVAVSVGVAGMVVNAAGGLLYQSVGYTGLYALCGSLGLVAAVLAWRAYSGAGAHAGDHAGSPSE